ncbi:winged helix-turn-helix domain-containing protein [Auraticoccus monumenti]|uniref:DNA-binding transcriptional regulator, ArsR family n=1 Tax=Auraticoccus monumenti TaxID=675864 RepID=A0A1G6TUC6_9ACTN|nr:winged helix-turn-helix domain-containing protein [Auraticoccus monumenti]SDD31967.1 DNA-binding transcriptional regulator, ArsR family [Auraticoccus monumenti]
MPDEPLDDYRVLVAVGHPLRRRLLDVLRVEQAATTSALAERLGVAVGSVSHHAKVLAEHGLVVPAPELAKDRRERWWRLGDARISWSSTQFADDPAGASASAAAYDLSVRLQLERLQTWRTERGSSSREWQDAATSTDTWLHLTPEEARELAEELTAVLGRWADHGRQGEDPRRQPVFAFAHTFPSRP